jgi:hypothetical protein
VSSCTTQQQHVCAKGEALLTSGDLNLIITVHCITIKRASIHQTSCMGTDSAISSAATRCHHQCVMALLAYLCTVFDSASPI